MLKDLSSARYGEHACNLGAILASKFAEKYKIPAFISDPVTVDELAPEARIAGSALFKKTSIFHALNQKAIAKRFAEETGKFYKNINLIVVHLGGGISIGVHKKGKVVDVNNALEEGPFTPERSGFLPMGQLVKLCFSGKYTEKEVSKILVGKGGLVSHLGTSDCRIIEKRILNGDKKAELIYKAMGYSIAKYIGAAATVLNGKVTAILLTGGGAKSRILVKNIKQKINFIAPVKVYPGENEMSSLASGALRALKGKEKILTYR
ncbi:MAG: butyrate kinase [Candidatus Firestonebacteria bacterium RIFOXYA2_FULL_40_8]|nr:MAG: butyrate kinase [Candidatus Firestonebacteria bacterium RIFOXYA2_FULL_40_8]